MALSYHDEFEQGVTPRHVKTEQDKRLAYGVVVDPHEAHQPRPYANSENPETGLPGGVAEGATHKPTRRNHIGTNFPTYREEA